MKKKIFLAWMAVIAVLGVVAFQYKQGDPKEESYMIYADYPEYDTASNLVSAADAVFSGKVTNITYTMLDVSGSGGSADVPYTLYTVTITDQYKGSLEGNTVTIKRPGGETNGAKYTLDEASEIEKGREYLFLVEVFEDSYPSLISADQASYDMAVSEDTSEEGISLQDILDVLE